MSEIINKIKDKTSGRKSTSQNKGDEQSFSIQPHPAKSNNPAEVEGPQLGGGLNSHPEYEVHHARDPHVPSREIANNLEQPASREELRARQAQLNK